MVTGAFKSSPRFDASANLFGELEAIIHSHPKGAGLTDGA